MTLRSFVALILVFTSSLAWGADRRKELSQARSNYRQAVAAHGAKSVEARRARQNLRAKRRSFHDERRRRKKE